MRHVGTPILDTERLRLRRLRVDDAQAMFAHWGQDPEVTRYLSWSPYEEVAACEAYLREQVACYKAKDFYLWGVELKATGELIGTMGLVDLVGSEATVGYCIGRPWWRQGLTSEAFMAMLDFLFDTVGFEHIKAYYQPENIASGKVLAKAGMEIEGEAWRTTAAGSRRCLKRGLSKKAWQLQHPKH